MSKISVFVPRWLLLMAVSSPAYAKSGVDDSVTITPYNMSLLGNETYAPEIMYRLTNPKFAYVHLNLAAAEGYGIQGNHLSSVGTLAMNIDFGIAGKVAGEIGENTYTSEMV